MSEPQTRYHGLDALRAGAMLLGLILHAALVYTEPDMLTELVPGMSPIEADPGVSALILWIHLWRMPLFFILAGFFAQMVLERRGARGFLDDRFIRILLTCLVFMSLHNLLSEQSLGTLEHLWFLWVLWWVCALAAGLHALGVRTPIRLLGHMVKSPARMLWLILPLTLVSLFFRDQTVIQRIPANLGDIEWRGALFCVLFFWLGQALWQERAVLSRLARPGLYLPLLILGTLSSGAIMVLADLIGGDIYAMPEADQARALLIAAPLAGIATGAISFGAIGLTQGLVHRSTALIRWLTRLAYPVYVFHLYPVITISVMLIELDPEIDQFLNLAISSVAAFAIATLLYYVFIRFTPLDWLFAGRKNAWWQWPFNEKGRPRQERPQS